MISLPQGVSPVTRGPSFLLERLKNEVSIIRTEAYYRKPYSWARENWFSRRSSACVGGRTLLAYSINGAGRIVRGWYLTEFDCRFDSSYRRGGCPVEAAWLASLMPGVESEPAWLYLREDTTTPTHP